MCVSVCVCVLRDLNALGDAYADLCRLCSKRMCYFLKARATIRSAKEYRVVISVVTAIGGGIVVAVAVATVPMTRA